MTITEPATDTAPTEEAVNPDVFINFVLDQSGSMLGIRQGTLDGFNQFIQEQVEVPGEAFLSLTLFSTSFDTRYTAARLSDTEPLGTGDNPYRPDGGTALLDAIGQTVKSTEEWLAAHPEFDGQVVCVVLTDGHENASKLWHLNHPTVDGDTADVGGLIRWKQEVDGWQFVFLGSGGSQWLERTFGHVVAKGQFAGYENTGASNMAAYASMSDGLTRSRSKGVPMAAPTADEIADALQRQSKP